MSWRSCEIGRHPQNHSRSSKRCNQRVLTRFLYWDLSGDSLTRIRPSSPQIASWKSSRIPSLSRHRDAIRRCALTTLPAGERRLQRFYNDAVDDQRTRSQRDRDRILYTSALRRLSGVTQVISADEGHVFHNRLTHTLEVAQVARRLAEKVLDDQPDIAERLGGIDPDVVEAAALAHDLGHPPFGHVGEEELQDVAGADEDSFEGNAQSFRILTRLACRYVDSPGLDLTRATLNASLKYPWFRDKGDPDRSRKWGAYRTEASAFDWARELGPADGQKCAEAEIMDLADDIAYAVHDVEDFYRARLIPLEVLRKSDREISNLIDSVFLRWEALRKKSKYSKGDLGQTLERLLRTTPFGQPYSGSREQRANLRSFTSAVIAGYVKNVKLVPADPAKSKVQIDPHLEMEITILKELTWQYVILNPKMVAREFGQRRVVRTLFEALRESAAERRSPLSTRPYLLPVPYREELSRDLEKCGTEAQKEQARTRIALDFVASMNDLQALRMYHRLTGISLGSILESLAV